MDDIKFDTQGNIERANQSIIICRNLLNTFKKEIIKQGFKSINEEIHFFKNIKQIPLHQLIYHSEIRSFEIQFPRADIIKQRKYVKKKLGKLNRFFLYNMDFEQYIESKQTHLDEQYFTRDYFDNLPITSSKFYFQDPDFSTPYDMLLGKLTAYNNFISYLQNRLINSKNPKINNELKVTNEVELQWTSTKTDLTELIYALHHNRVINNGKSDIKEIASVLERVLHFDIGDCYKTFAEIKTRKMSRTKFLDDLSDGLTTYINNSEE
ncbi:RteC domain-containing protein [Mariniflexile sp. AS56]|uniref:RteC domain-containing protein n=1 Tax=Mariniflexile sp. AS56 TaxID=3063957 RepID=UPI0026F28E22|nr:RteC domain-containing protein [Mariniflexile sp. AS56]MDO7173199.1 RteC domain-containing protein [Mariniflexile sp. AS56]